MRRVAVIGGGLSGLTAAFYIMEEASARSLDVDVSLWESESRFGGKIGTVEQDGFRCETGPNGFLDNTPQTLELVDRLGLTHRLLPSSDAARRRFIFSGGKLQQLPESPPAFMRSGLLTLSGRLRVFGEFFVPARKEADADEDETVASFIRRRLGEEALQKLIDPMTSGIYAGDPEKMSMASCFPRVVALERRYGGLIRGMLAKQREAKRSGGRGPEGAGPGGRLTSFEEGLQELVDALASALGDRARTASPVRSLTFSGSKDSPAYTIALDGGPQVSAEAVVIATPAYAAADILSGVLPEAAGMLRSIPYAAVSVVHFGLDSLAAGHDLNGFGFLIPRSEGRGILGSLWTSSIFRNRAPESKVLMTTMVGGARDSRRALLDERTLTDIVQSELQATMALGGTPGFTLLTRWEKAIPQYLQGHEALLRRIEERLSGHAGLFLAGNAYRGIGVNDCIKASLGLAPRVVDALQRSA